MYDAPKAKLDSLKSRFDEKLEARSPEAREVGREYLESLTEFLSEVDHGPVVDPEIARVDTTGAVNRTGEYSDWVAEEHVRVRRALRDLA